ncbi:MAG: glycosyltransferase [Dehalococcoidales bacterium]|nr:glycosyltransferase [Dehalococcoidales bacterium]
MRLAFLVVHSCPLGQPGSRNTGGMNVYVRELAVHLATLGHSIDIYTRTHTCAEKQLAEIAANVRLIHISDGCFEETDKLKMYDSVPEFTRNLEQFRLQNKCKYDLIFSHYWISGAAGLVLQKQWRVPHLTMFHTLGLVKNKLSIHENEPEIRIQTERLITEKCDRIIATTKDEKQLLAAELAVNPAKIAVTPCGVNLDIFRTLDKQACREKLHLEPREKVILFVGRIEKIKGIDPLLGAMGLLNDMVNLKLLIVGGDSDDSVKISAKKKEAIHLGMKNHLVLHPAVPQDMLPVYYNAADVFVLPSYSESFGMVALESLACGTPVVANNVGDMKNIIKPVNGMLLEDNTPALLAGGLRKVLQNPTFYDTAVIRESVIKYDWSHIAAQINREIGILHS